MTDDEILHEAEKLVEDGICVTFPVKGQSMLPFIIGGTESVILTKPEGLSVGHVVLALTEEKTYVVHRIIAIDGDRVTLMGDGNLVGTEHCSFGDVKFLISHVVDEKGRQHYLYNTFRRVAARLWYVLRPARKYLLIIYRKL